MHSTAPQMLMSFFTFKLNLTDYSVCLLCNLTLNCLCNILKSNFENRTFGLRQNYYKLVVSGIAPQVQILFFFGEEFEHLEIWKISKCYKY